MAATIVDGFSYSLNYRMLCGYYNTVILEQLRALRLTNNYVPRFYVVPDSSSIVVPAFGTYEYQVQMPQGTVWWAYSFSNPNGAYSFNIFDPCTGRVASDGILGSGTSPTQWQGQCILPTPYFVPARGLLNVEIGSTSTTDSTASTFQLVLYCMEPVETNCVKL
jgi:hypothetical protein